MRIRLPGLYIALGLVLAGLIHIVAVLALPALAPKNGFSRLASLGPVNTIIQLPPAAPGQQPMPMMAPDVRYAFCRFDLSGGPVRLNARIADELLLIALYTPEAENFYSVVGADMKRAGGRSHHLHGRADRRGGRRRRSGIVRQRHRRQFAGQGRHCLLRLPLAGPSRAGYAEQALKATSCGPYTKQARASRSTSCGRAKRVFAAARRCVTSCRSRRHARS